MLTTWLQHNIRHNTLKMIPLYISIRIVKIAHEIQRKPIGKQKFTIAQIVDNGTLLEQKFPHQFQPRQHSVTG
jgi:hypothetical protein